MDWKFKKDVEPQGGSDGFWYDITRDYIKPELLLDDPEQLKAVTDAVDLLMDFEASLEYEGLLNEF